MTSFSVSLALTLALALALLVATEAFVVLSKASFHPCPSPALWMAAPAPAPAPSFNARRVLGSAMAAFAVLGASTPSFAAVGEGDLPPGAMAFSKILKYQSDWSKLSESIKTRSSTMEEKEVQSIKIFLKQLANEYSDMELLAKGIPEAEKSKEAIQIAKEFRKEVRQCDDLIADKQFEKVLALYPATARLMSEYLGLLQDVPDEL